MVYAASIRTDLDSV